MYLSNKAHVPSPQTAPVSGQSTGASGALPFFGPSLNARNLVNSFDQTRGIFWSSMKPENGGGCFTLPLLHDMHQLAGDLGRYHEAMQSVGSAGPSYFVSSSSIPGTYNLGGDLALFADKIRRGERESIGEYAHACIDVVYANSKAFDLPIITMALLQGDALGGGLECALSYDLIVAERGSKLGLPEPLFNLFPGMGALSFLTRKIGSSKAEHLVQCGKTFLAEEMYEMGVVNILAEPGQGVAAVHDFVEQKSRRQNTAIAVQKARRRVAGITEAELRDVVEIWADAAMELQPADLRMMDRLSSRQRRRLGARPEEREAAAG